MYKIANYISKTLVIMSIYKNGNKWYNIDNKGGNKNEISIRIYNNLFNISNNSLRIIYSVLDNERSIKMVKLEITLDELQTLLWALEDRKTMLTDMIMELDEDKWFKDTFESSYQKVDKLYMELKEKMKW